jgi:ABC-2 type transport system permease protein
MTSRALLSAEARAQYAAMFAMRWRVFVNGLHSIHGVLDLGATGIAWTLYAVFGLGMGTGLAAAGYAMAQQGAWQRTPILFWAASVLWLMVPVIAASYQEQSSMGVLLRFPVRLGSYFTLYLISGLMDASTIVGSLCCFGIWLGIFLARREMAGPLAVVLVIFAGFNVLLVRTVFAWIERWLAQRKSREILGAVIVVLFLSAQLFNPAIYRHGRNHAASVQQKREHAGEIPAQYAPLLRTVNKVQRWLAPGAAAGAVQEDAGGRPAPASAWLGLLGLWCVVAGGTLGVRLRAEYRGENLGWAPARSQSTEPERYWTLGGSGACSAAVEKELRSLKRTLPQLFAVGAPLLLVLVIAGLFHPGSSGHAFQYALPLCVAYALLGFTGLSYNNLGAEGAGIQLLFLSPTPIRTVMLAKNVLHGVLYVLVAGAAAALGCLRLGVPPWPLLAALGAWVLFALPCNLTAGNILSLTMPYRVNPGRIGRPPGSQANALTAMLIQAGVLAVGGFVFAVCQSFHRSWWAVAVLLVLATAAYFAWQRVLSNVDAMALERREELIESLMKA